METTEGKYAHLLQPIRELAKNWDINVASELNDYLEEVQCSDGNTNRDISMFSFFFCDVIFFCGVLSLSLSLQLDEMSITFDGGITRLNFAEAALLIQGTACIYSKKVCV